MIWDWGWVSVAARHYLVMTSVLVTAGLVLSVLFRRRAAQSHGILLASVLCAVAAPTCSLVARHFGLGMLPPPVMPAHRAEPGPQLRMPAAEAEQADPVAELRIDKTAAVTSQPGKQPVLQVVPLELRDVAAVVWIGISCILLVRLALTFMWGVKTVRSAHVVNEGILIEAAESARLRVGLHRQVQVRRSGSIQSPSVWCWGRRVVLLVPDAADKLQDHWRGWFCHELGHARRQDHLSGLLMELVTCVLPWQPLLWVARRRLRALSEQVCDDWALVCGCERTHYAESLLNVTLGRRTALVPAVVSGRTELAHRVRRIVSDGCGNPRVRRSWVGGLTVTTVVLAASGAVAQPGPAVHKTLQAEPVQTHSVRKKNYATAWRGLWLAAMQGRAARVSELLEAGARVDALDDNNRTALGYAAGGGHLETVKVLLQAGAKIDAKVRPRMRPLGHAVAGGHSGMVRFLISRNADVNMGDASGRVALHYAAEQGHKRIVEILAAAGARLEISTPNGLKPLHLAAMYGHREVAAALIDNGAKIGAKDSSAAQPLATAAKYGHMEVVRLLLEAGAELGAKDYKGRTALYEAIHEGHEEIARLLISRGARIPFSQLHLAAYLGDASALQRLLDKGADIDGRDGDGFTPLYYAGLEGQTEAFELLLKRGAQVDALNNAGRTVLAELAGKGRTEMVKRLLAEGADVNCRVIDGPGRKAALHLAVMGGHADTTKVLLDAGAHIEATDYCRMAPLHRAAQQDDAGVLTELLLAYGAEVDSRCTGTRWTPLHWAAYGDRIASAKLLIQHGADVNAKDRTGLTPLHRAVMSSEGTCLTPGGRCRVAELLIAEDARIDAEDENGLTPLHCAAQRGSIAAAQLLLDNGADLNAATNVARTALHYAAKAGRGRMVEWLIARGIPVNARDKAGKTALGLVPNQRGRRTAVIELLKAHGAVR